MLPIVIFKLLTGEVGIGVLNEEQKRIEKVLFVGIYFNPDELSNKQPKQKISLIPPFYPFSEKLPNISLDYVICYEEVTNKDIANLYFQLSTNLVLPNEKDFSQHKGKAHIANLNPFLKIN